MMRITVKVKPNSSKQDIKLEGNVYTISLTSPPIEGRANNELIKVLSDYFNVPRSKISIVSGYRSRIKIVDIEEEV